MSTRPAAAPSHVPAASTSLAILALCFNTYAHQLCMPTITSIPSGPIPGLTRCMTTSYKPRFALLLLASQPPLTFGLTLPSTGSALLHIHLCLPLPPLALPLSPCLPIHLASPQLHACRPLASGPNTFGPAHDPHHHVMSPVGSINSHMPATRM